MTKQEVETIAQEIFKKHPEAKVAFITSDGFAFLHKNAADLHKNTNGKKKLEVIEAPNKDFATTKTEETNISKMNKTLLTELAISKGIEVTAEATKAEIIALIEAVLKSEIKE